ncbi:hypothetical protein ACIBH1_48675 [Nonomuraea sp. NPDC050663]|uniref:hypothetical protein n=1 Tax=Nonomuraea sp. NPDC050663 TaxID=3364370 RepID=UPI003788448A
MGFFFQGIGWVAKHGRWWLFGLIPAVIAFAVYVVALIFLGKYAFEIADFATPFADSWSWRDTFRTIMGVMGKAGSCSQMAIRTWRSSMIGVARAQVMGGPAGGADEVQARPPEPGVWERQ